MAPVPTTKSPTAMDWQARPPCDTSWLPSQGRTDKHSCTSNSKELLPTNFHNTTLAKDSD